MNVVGSWQGKIQKVSLDGSAASEQLVFHLDIRRDWLGRLTGTVTAKSLYGKIGPGEVHGSARWRSIKFTWLLPVPYTIEFDGFRPLQSQPAGGEALPIQFNGKLENSGQSAYGEWQTTTWMMKRDSTRKILVILDHGRWRMSKQTGSQELARLLSAGLS